MSINNHPKMINHYHNHPSYEQLFIVYYAPSLCFRCGDLVFILTMKLSVPFVSNYDQGELAVSYRCPG
jgi:hypothetical protein